MSFLYGYEKTVSSQHQFNMTTMKRTTLLLLTALLAMTCHAQNHNVNQVVDIKTIPETAKRIASSFATAVYISTDSITDDPIYPYIRSIWIADEQVETARLICTTNPKAEAQWDKMSAIDANAVEVPIDMIAVADTAILFPGDASYIIVEGCPDGRNVWTYIIDTETNTAKQFPSTSGLAPKNWKRGEVVLNSYGYYEEGGRYSFKCAYDCHGKFLRRVGGIEPE